MGKYIDVQVSTGLTSGLTSVDGTVVEYPAIIKYRSEFPMNSNNIIIDTSVFRSRELFENGYQGVEVIEFEKNRSFELSDHEMGSLTPYGLAEKIADDLNYELGYTGSTKGFVVITGSTEI